MIFKAKIAKYTSDFTPEEEVTLPDGRKTLEALVPVNIDILSEDGNVIGTLSTKLPVGGFMSGGLWLDDKQVPEDGILQINLTVP